MGVATRPDEQDFQNQNSKTGDERQTRHRVFDDATVKVFDKLISQRLITEVYGCISSGKEANVYDCLGAVGNATTGEDGEPVGPVEPAPRLAVKIHATTTKTFRSRQEYMAGWTNTNGVRSGREMIAQWAANEFNHLRRLRQAGIPCPEPIAVKENILIMRLLGDEKGEAYPTLLRATLSPSPATTSDNDLSSTDRWMSIYRTLLGYIRRMYKVSRLVHGDLSEYNTLLDEHDCIHIIDVSQALEHQHPESLNKLRLDIQNVNTFFKKKVQVLNEAAVFIFVTSDKYPLELDKMDEAIDELYGEQPVHETTEEIAQAETEANAFRSRKIPRTLNEAYDMAVIGGVDIDTTAIDHLIAEPEQANGEPVDEAGEDSERSSSDSEDEDPAPHSGDDGDGASTSRPRGKKHMDKEEKHAHKMAVKEEKREKRKDKMPKKEKAARVAKSSKKTRSRRP